MVLFLQIAWSNYQPNMMINKLLHKGMNILEIAMSNVPRQQVRINSGYSMPVPLFCGVAIKKQ